LWEEGARQADQEREKNNGGGGKEGGEEGVAKKKVGELLERKRDQLI